MFEPLNFVILFVPYLKCLVHIYLVSQQRILKLKPLMKHWMFSVCCLQKKTCNDQLKGHLSLIKNCIKVLVSSETNKCSKRLTGSIPKDNARQDRMFENNSVLDTGSLWMFSNNVDAFGFFLQIENASIVVDAGALAKGLVACASERVCNPGRKLHALAITAGVESFISIQTSLVGFYVRCGYLRDAWMVFSGMPTKNVVSWTAIISGFAQHGHGDKCYDLLCEMRLTELKPNDFTYASILSSFIGYGALAQGKRGHCQIIHSGLYAYTHVTNALVTMYAKCGSIQDASNIFCEMPTRDLISWNAMITGFAQNGLAKQAVELFTEMVERKIKPDAITLLGVLSSCRHAGLVEEGWHYFHLMVHEHGIKPNLDHYACMVDLLGRAGLIQTAENFIRSMPISPNAVIWGSLLSSCRQHQNVKTGSWAANNRLSLEPNCAATYVQLANLYASAGCWRDAARVRKWMKEKGLKTNTGYSWIEMGNKLHGFRVEEESNHEMNEVYSVLDGLRDQMRTLSYVPVSAAHEED